MSENVKISYKDYKFITKVMENRKVELLSLGQNLQKIQKGIC